MSACCLHFLEKIDQVMLFHIHITVVHFN
jgi:hypothetical protein